MQLVTFIQFKKPSANDEKVINAIPTKNRNPFCPHCRCYDTFRHGKTDKLNLRYLCNSCLQTFVIHDEQITLRGISKMQQNRFCTTCNGQGRILGFGYIKQDCEDCKGLGHVVISEPAVQTIELNNQPESTKKKGRPKKEK